MSTTRYTYEPFVESVLCVADFSHAGLSAFAHALTLAINARGEFVLLQPGKPGKEWAQMPGVREMLEKWGYLERGSNRGEVFDKLAVRVVKVQVADAYKGVIEVLQRRSVDLVVVPSEPHGDLVSLLKPSTAEKIAHETRTMTLFVPAHGKGFVSVDKGELKLKNILIPVNSESNPRPAMTYAMRSALFSTEEMIHLHLLHVGDGPAPVLRETEKPYLTWHQLKRKGDPTEQILKVAEELDADLIVMATRSGSGFFDSWRGSVPDKVVRRTKWPVLAVPLEE
jgi:nucleotide-binding universal stress UspA family protein